MMSTLREQQQFLRNQFAISHHTFLNRLANGLQQRLMEEVPQLQLRYSGKATAGVTVAASVSGTAAVANEGEVEAAKEKVRLLWDDLKNPTELLAMLR